MSSGQVHPETKECEEEIVEKHSPQAADADEAKNAGVSKACKGRVTKEGKKESEKEERKKTKKETVHLRTLLFRYATGMDIMMMTIGTVAAAICG